MNYTHCNITFLDYTKYSKLQTVDDCRKIKLLALETVQKSLLDSVSHNSSKKYNACNTTEASNENFSRFIFFLRIVESITHLNHQRIQLNEKAIINFDMRIQISSIKS